MKTAIIIISIVFLIFISMFLLNQKECYEGHYETQMQLNVALYAATKVPISTAQEVFVCDIYKDN